jgi:hypothetical protein
MTACGSSSARREISTSTAEPPRLALSIGAIAQLGERLLCKQEVTGSNPVGSIPKSLAFAGLFLWLS